MAAGVAPGLVALVADRDGICCSAAAGLLRAGNDAAMTLDAVFWLASCTKLVTSIAALQCVERGALSLGAPVADVLPEAARLEVLAGIDDDGAAQLRPPRHAMTLRHLLTHGSGLGYDLMNSSLLRFHGEYGPPPPTSLRSLDGPLLFDPGDGWVYGVGSDWAGRMVEAATGQRLDAYFAEHIFAALGLRDIGFVAPAGRPRASLHQRSGPSAFVEIPCPVDDLTAWEYLSGGGGLLGTATDFVRILRAVLRFGELDGVRILQLENARLLFRIATGDRRAGAIPSVVPAINAAVDFFPDQLTGWSLAGLINPAGVAGGRSAGSLAWAGIANTYYWVDPAAGLCAVLMAQSLPFAEASMLDTLRKFEQLVYRA